MPARLLAYGGTSYSERRRIGQWPAVPEATLRDSYGLLPNAWCYGVGVLDRQPFLIFRQRQNVESRGGYPYSLLLDPGEPVWVRFGWNPAALIEAVLRASPEVLFRTPDTCSQEALDRQLADLPVPAPTAGEPETISLLLAASLVRGPLAVSLAERPDPAKMPGALAPLPACFRLGRGWLVGGGITHGRALGANLVIDEQASPAEAGQLAAGRELLAAWESASQRGIVQGSGWSWEQTDPEYLDAVALLDEIETAPGASEELIGRADAAVHLRHEIDRAIEALLLRGTGPVGPRGTSLLVGFVLQGGRALPAGVAARLEEGAVVAALRRFGAPPKAVPAGLPVGRELVLKLWSAYLENLSGDVAQNLTLALSRIQPNQNEAKGLAQAALLALAGSDESLTDWLPLRADADLWPVLAEPFRRELLRRFRRGLPGAAEAYLLLGDDPGGSRAGADAQQLTTAIRGLQRQYPAEVQRWLGDLPRPAVTRPKPQPQANQKAAQLRTALRQALFETDPDQVEDSASDLVVQFEDFNTPQLRAEMDGMIEENAAESGGHFAAAYSNKYAALGDVMLFLTANAQDRLMECFAQSEAAPVSEFASSHIGFALNNAFSQNNYTRALARLILKDRTLLKRVAVDLIKFPDELEGELKKMLTKKKESRT